MSTTQRPITECKACETEYEHGWNGAYCSEECYWRAKGDGILRMIANDHRYCSSCWSLRKTISEPPEAFLRKRPRAIQEAIIGFEYLTENMKQGNGLLYCECGNVDHFADHDVLKELDLGKAIANLWRILTLYYEEGQFGDNRPNKTVLFETLKETDMEWPVALGKCVYGDTTK